VADSPSNAAPTHTVRVGRLTVELPESAVLDPAITGGTHDWTPIREEPWPADLARSGDARDEARAGAWGRLAEAARAGLERERRGARNRGRDPDALQLDDRPVSVDGAEWARALTWPSHNGTDVSVVVAADAGPVWLVVEKTVSAPKLPESLDLFATALGAYVPAGAPGYPTDGWLFFRHGAIARGPSGLEVAAATFDGPAPFEDLLVGMQTRLVPHRGPALVERFRQAERAGLGRLLGPVLPRGLDADLREVRAGPRPAGALDGEEVVVEVRSTQREGAGRSTTSVVELEWEHLGTPQDGRDPDVTVKASTPPGPPLTPQDEARVLAAWDAILSSLRLLPPAP
jgi:hypothetical protein